MRKRPDNIARNKSIKQRMAVSKSWENLEVREKRVKSIIGNKWNVGNKNALGHRLSDEVKAKVIKNFEGQVREKHPQWKGNNVGYGALHDWVRKVKGKPISCEHCNSTKNVEWANKSYQYSRDENDWLSLCAKCHDAYDRKNNSWGLASKKFKKGRYGYLLS